MIIVFQQPGRQDRAFPVQASLKIVKKTWQKNLWLRTNCGVFIPRLPKVLPTTTTLRVKTQFIDHLYKTDVWVGRKAGYRHIWGQSCFILTFLLFLQKQELSLTHLEYLHCEYNNNNNKNESFCWCWLSQATFHPQVSQMIPSYPPSRSSLGGRNLRTWVSLDYPIHLKS